MPFTPDLNSFFNQEENTEELEKLLQLIPKKFQGQKTIRNIIEKSLSKNDFDYVARNIKYANNKSNAAKPGANILKGSNYRNYLSKALSGDFGLAFQEDLEAASIAKKVEIAKIAEENEKQRKENAKIEAERDFAIQAKNYIESLDFKAKKLIEEEAIKSLSSEDQQMLSEERVQAKFTLKAAIKKIVQERLNLSHKK